MDVILEAIKFNHDPNSATTDAFNIRRNESTPIVPPEWQRGVSVNPEDSPAAFAKSKVAGASLTIRVKLSFVGFDESIETIAIQATDGHIGLSTARNVLGTVLKRNVNLKGGEEFELFNLDKVTIEHAGVSRSDVIWHWQFSLDCQNWTDFAETKHRIYTVLALPNTPWKCDPADSSNSEQPWTEVLDFACRWAASATSLPQAAAMVTRSINGLGGAPLYYDNHQSGSTGFTLDTPPTFDCADFLLLLRGQPHRHGPGVNCDDCSAFVVTFANILGCNLSERQMENDFPLHPHLRIGDSALTENRHFSHHTVAWSGAAGEDDEVFDACVQLDSDDDPANAPHPLFVPADMAFGRLNQRLYRFRLTSDPTQCNPVGDPIRRSIAFIKLIPDEAALSALKKARNKRQQQVIETFKKIVNTIAPGSLFASWNFEGVDFILDKDSLLFAQSFLRHKKDADEAMQIDAYAASSVDESRAKIKKLVSRFQLPDIKRLAEPDFGDIVYAVPEQFVVLFARSEFVIQIRNVGKRLASSKDLAVEIDHWLTAEIGKYSAKRFPKTG
jgi:hypothetical protein